MLFKFLKEFCCSVLTFAIAIAIYILCLFVGMDLNPLAYTVMVIGFWALWINRD